MQNGIKRIFVLGIMWLVVWLCPMTAAAANDYSRVVVTGYEVVDGSFTPGETVTLSLLLHNPSKQWTASNILLTYGTEGSNVLPVYGQANQLYLDCLKPNEEVEIQLELSIPKDITGDTARMNYHVSYGDETYSSYAYTATIAAPISGGCQIKLEDIYVSSSSVKGDPSLIRLQYANIGMQQLEDVTLHVTWAGETKEIPLERLNPGASGSVEHDLVFTEIGEQTVSLKLSYTDQNGIPYYTENQTKTIQVVETTDNFQNALQLQQGNGKGDLQLTSVQLCIILAFCVLAVMGGIWLFGSKRNLVK